MIFFRWFLLFLLYFPVSLFAFKFSPMSVTLTPQGQGARQLVFVENDGKGKIAIQISVTKRVVDQKGVEQYSDAEDLFLIYPSQLILGPGEKRAIKVDWRGNKEIKTEQAFRLVAEQLPVDFDRKKTKKSNIKILLRYLASLYVAPEGLHSQLKVVSVECHDGILNVGVANRGFRHQVMHELVLTINGKSKDKKKLFLEMKGDALKGMTGENILADNQRLFELKSPPILLCNRGEKIDLKISYTD